MKFLHLGDLHIGKVLNGRSMIEDQSYILQQVIDLVKAEDIRLVVIAGDLYDRSIPSIEAIELLNTFLDVLINLLSIKVCIISGNHDSAERLSFASSILKDKGLIIETTIQKEISNYILNDQYGDICFHLVPYFKPSKIKMLFDNQEIKTYQDALQYYLKQNQTVFLDGKRHVLVTHQFFSGKTASLTSESELPLSVGGAEIIDASIVKDFDYVALGHLHAPQSVGYSHIRYSGSLLKYSIDEAKQHKSVCIVNMLEKGNLTIEKRELRPLRDIRVLTGYFDDIMKQKQGNLEDYVAFILNDETMITNAMDRARSVYPNALMITYLMYQQQLEQSNDIDFVDVQKKSDEELFSIFYQQVTGVEFNEDKEKLFLELLDEYRRVKDDEN